MSKHFLASVKTKGPVLECGSGVTDLGTIFFNSHLSCINADSHPPEVGTPRPDLRLRFGATRSAGSP